MPDITLADARQAKALLEASIFNALTAAVAEFKATTGLTPSDIRISMLPTQAVEQQYPTYMVGDVVANVPAV